MISNQILQSTVDGLSSITGKNFGVLNSSGKLLVSAHPMTLPNGFAGRFFEEFEQAEDNYAVYAGYNLCKIMDDIYLEYIAITETATDSEGTFCKMAAFQLNELQVAYREHYDKDNYIKNLLLDNMLLVDVYMRAKKLRIENNVERVVYYIESAGDKETNISIMEVLRGLYPLKDRDFITAVDESHIILVKDVSDDSARKTIEKTAEVLENMLSTEVMGSVRIAIGSVVRDLKDISRSYKEAKMACEVGKIFYEEKQIINFNWLGIGRLIFQLPNSLCKMYIDEIFTEMKVEELDEEMLMTINKFFQNSLNISETSRQLFIHRNTLVYRLDKLQKNTGLDIRTFDDAITFKIALMVAKYMNYLENTDY